MTWRAISISARPVARHVVDMHLAQSCFVLHGDKRRVQGYLAGLPSSSASSCCAAPVAGKCTQENRPLGSPRRAAPAPSPPAIRVIQHNHPTDIRA